METLVQKLISKKLGRPVQVGEIVELPIDLAWGSEMTIQFAIDNLREHGFLNGSADARIKENAKKIMFPFDHLIPAIDAKSASLMVNLREFAKKYGIRVFEVGYDGGIQHRLFEERGFLHPGAIGVGADSHSCTYGAMAALGTGIGSSDFAAAMLNASTWMQVPSSIRVELNGKTRAFVTGKDIVLYLIGLQGVDGATYQSLEFCGDGVAGLDMASRFSISNMAIEGGAKFGLFPVDSMTRAYLLGTVARDFPNEIRFEVSDIEAWMGVEGDPNAEYTRLMQINLNDLEPMVALPYSPENTLGIYQLFYLLKNHLENKPEWHELVKAILPRVNADRNIPVQQIFIGSCTNGRIEDLRVAASIFKGKKVAAGVRVVVIPASQHVYRQALREGLLEIFLEFGCYVESSSCGPCIGIKSGVVGRDEVAIFTSNRNFYGRTGDKRSLVILASPAVAAQSALQGVLSSPAPQAEYYTDEKEIEKSLQKYLLVRRQIRADRERIFYQASVKDFEDAEREKIFSQNFSSGEYFKAKKTAWVFANDINTDLIMPARYCNITDPKEYKKFVLLDTENKDFLNTFEQKQFQLDGDILIAGKNFGCGSSRESAPMGIKVAGFSCVIAHSFARIFYRNAFNIGLLVLEIGSAAYQIKQRDELIIDAEAGMIYNLSQKKSYQAKPVGEFQKQLLKRGGLLVQK
jgi:3-isopropylmalate dehydratase large subunit